MDLDGTLIDSEPWYKKTEVAALNDFGVPITLEQMEEFTGLTLPVWLEKIDERFGKSLTVEEFLSDYKPQMIAHVANDVPLFEDAARLLGRLNGTPAMLVTSSMDWYVEAVLERFPEIRRAVQGVVCEADVVRGKPEPEPYVLAAKRLGFPPQDCWVVEDAPNGILAGLAAGCTVLGIDRHDRGNVSAAHRVVRSLDSIDLS